MKDQSYHPRDHADVHTVFLMVLLRVGDYLQIQAERAPKIAYHYRRIPSKTSQREWDAHNAVESISYDNDDPESIRVIAWPKDVLTFLRLKEWLTGIESELDASWAVLGEVYGRSLPELGLVLRGSLPTSTTRRPSRGRAG